MLKNFRSQLAGAFLAAVLAAGLTVFATSTINTANPPNGQPYSASTIRNNFSAAANDINALQDLNVGSSAPVTCNLANVATPWLNNSTTPYQLNYCDGTGTWLLAGSWDVVNHIFTPNTGRGAEQTITVAATLDLGSVPQSAVLASGNSSVNITSLGSSAKAGDLKIVRFNGANTLVYNATSLILPGATNATTSNGTVWLFESLGSGNWLGVANVGGGTGTVTSFNGRSGAVVPISGDYSFSLLSGTIAYAQMISPLQSGTTNYVPCWQSSSVLIDCSPTQIAGLLPSVAPPGSTTNLNASLTSVGNSVTVKSDGFVACTALTSATCVELGNYSQTFNGATTGAGGMDTGGLPSNGSVCLYAIYNPGSSLTSILGVNCATSSGTIYSGGNMPSGYTMSALLGAWPTNGTPNLVVGSFTAFPRRVVTMTTQSLTSGSSATYTTPSGVTWIKVRACGGGGGGAGSGNGGAEADGVAGGNTTFSSYTANGGGRGRVSNNASVAGGGTSGSPSIGITGGTGSTGATATNTPGGGGAASPFGGAGGGVQQANGQAATANSCSGGAGAGNAGSAGNAGGGGSAGGYFEQIIVSPAATYTYTVGAAGTGGAGAGGFFNGAAGGAGYITVEEHYGF